MPAVGGDGLEKLEDMIVRAAETSADHVRAAKAAIGTVIFGQDKVIEQALVTILSGGHALLLGVPGLAKTKLVETMGIVLGLDARRIQFTPDLMPSDILGTEVLGGKPDRQAQLPLPLRPGVRPAADGGRNQPRQPAHPVGAAASDAGAARYRRRHASRSAAPVPRARDPKPARAGRHLSAAGSPARPLPDGNRCRLSRPRRRAEDPVRDDRRRGDAGEAGDDRRRPDDGAAAGAALAGRRIRRRGHPRAGALGTAGAGRRRSCQTHRLGAVARAPARRLCLRYARARCSIGGLRRRSTTCSISPSRCSSTAWRSLSPRARKAKASRR